MSVASLGEEGRVVTLPASSMRQADRRRCRVERAGHRADELLDGGIGAAELGDAPAQAQHLDVVGHLEHLGHVVADQHDGDALVGDAAHELEHLAGLAHAEGGGGLVHEDHLVGPHHRAADRHALLLAARQRADRRVEVLHVGAHAGERVAGLLAHRLLVEHAEACRGSRA